MDTEKIASELCNDEKFWEYCNDSMMVHLLVSGKALCKGAMCPNTKAESRTRAAIERMYDDLDAKTIDEINEKVIEKSLHDDRFNSIEQNIEKFKRNFIECYETVAKDVSFSGTKTKEVLKDWYGDLLNSYVYTTDDERRKIYSEWCEKLLDPNKLYNEHKNIVEERINEIRARFEKAAEKAESLWEEKQAQEQKDAQFK